MTCIINFYSCCIESYQYNPLPKHGATLTERVGDAWYCNRSLVFVNLFFVRSNLDRCLRRYFFEGKSLRSAFYFTCPSPIHRDDSFDYLLLHFDSCIRCAQNCEARDNSYGWAAQLHPNQFSCLCAKGDQLKEKIMVFSTVCCCEGNHGLVIFLSPDFQTHRHVYNSFSIFFVIETKWKAY